MRFFPACAVGLLLGGFSKTAATYTTRFFAETGGLENTVFNTPLPMQYNLSDSQALYPLDSGYTNSYWSTSFVYGSDEHEYLIVSHFLVNSQLGFYRASMLDITKPSVYSQFTTLFNRTDYAPTDLNFEFSDYAFVLAKDDPLGPINTWSTNPDVKFNLTFYLSAPVILNGGLGTFQWHIPTVVNEWSMPAGLTTGSFEIENRTVIVDPLRSLTWYDRQWNIGNAANWTWFEMHLDSSSGNTGEKLSMWFYPAGYDNITKGFASIRDQAGVQTVVPANLIPGERTWTSPSSKATYHLDWTIELLDGTVLNASTTRDDQELNSASGSFYNYEGYIDISGIRRSGTPTKGFGLVEIQPPADFGL